VCLPRHRNVVFFLLRKSSGSTGTVAPPPTKRLEVFGEFGLLVHKYPQTHHLLLYSSSFLYASKRA
jgi:hypothetical protein